MEECNTGRNLVWKFLQGPVNCCNYKQFSATIDTCTTLEDFILYLLPNGNNVTHCLYVSYFGFWEQTTEVHMQNHFSKVN